MKLITGLKKQIPGSKAKAGMMKVTSEGSITVPYLTLVVLKVHLRHPVDYYLRKSKLLFYKSKAIKIIDSVLHFSVIKRNFPPTLYIHASFKTIYKEKLCIALLTFITIVMESLRWGVYRFN